LFDVTKINIKNVNKDKYDINLTKCGSSLIYSIEYKCTKLEIKDTTNNIVTVKLSKQKSQFIIRVSENIHGNSVTLIQAPVFNININKFNDIKKEIITDKVVIKQIPLLLKRPKKKPDKKAKKGSSITKINILYKINYG
jgi:hypothetical protein